MTLPEKNASITIGHISAENDEIQLNERTVLANTSPSADFVEIKLLGTPANGSQTELAAWNTYSDMINSTNEINLTPGIWTFTLTAKRYGASFSQTLSESVVSADSRTVLSFTNLAVTATSAGKGKVHVEFTFPSSLQGLSSCKAKFGDEAETTLTLTGRSCVYEAGSVDDGSYKLTFRGLNASGTEILNYPTYVVVKKGYISSSTINGSISEITKGQNTPVKVTYMINDGSSTTSYEQTYNKGSSLYTYSAVGFTKPTSKTFVGWCTYSTLNRYGCNLYKAGEQPVFTGDTTLYAIWMNTDTQVLVSYNSNTNPEQNYIEIKDRSNDKTLKVCGSSNSSLSSLGYSKTGYGFVGWDTKPDGSGTRYDEISWTLDNLNSSIKTLKLYAIWCPINNSGYFLIKNQNDYNALFNSKIIGTSGCMAVSRYIYFDSSMNNMTLDTSVSKDKVFYGILSGPVDGVTLKDLTSVMFKENQGTITNLKIAGKAINDDAAIALINKYRIRSCVVSADVKGKTSSKNVGGICSENLNGGRINNCDVTASISNAYADNVGGIAGYNAAEITGCKNYKVNSGVVVAATIAGMKNVGGIAGTNVKIISECKSAASINGAGTNSNVGGIAGYNTKKDSSNGSVQFSYFWGTVSASASIENTNVGGIIGKSVFDTQQVPGSNSAVYVCGAAGKLVGGKYAGGLIGYNIKSAAAYSYSAIERTQYYSSLGQPIFAGLYAYAENPEWLHCYTSKQNGAELNAVRMPVPKDTCTYSPATSRVDVITDEIKGILKPSDAEICPEEEGDSNEIPLYLRVGRN